MCDQEEDGISMLQQEKNIRTQVLALLEDKTRRMQQLKTLMEQDQDLCDILCSSQYGIAPDSVPSLEQLENFQQHISNQKAEKVSVFLPSQSAGRGADRVVYRKMLLLNHVFQPRLGLHDTKTHSSNT